MGFAEIVYDFDYCDRCNKAVPRIEGRELTTEETGPYLFLCLACLEELKP